MHPLVQTCGNIAPQRGQGAHVFGLSTAATVHRTCKLVCVTAAKN